jgi:hypothetical protein
MAFVDFKAKTVTYRPRPAPDAVSIDADLIPFDLWGYDKNIIVPTNASLWHLSKFDFPWNHSHETAESFARGTAGRQDVEKHFTNYFDPARVKLGQDVLGLKAKALLRCYEQMQQLQTKSKSPKFDIRRIK